MHNHNNNNSGGGHKGMMWMMIMCFLLLGALFLVGGKLSSSGGYLWPILIGVFVVAHIWMMFKGHGGHNNTDTDEKANMGEDAKTKGEHKHGGCCH